MIITSDSPSFFIFHHIPKLIRLATLFTLHSSLFTLHSLMCRHRAICKSPLQQNAKALMLIWDNHSSPHTQAHSLGYTLHFSLFTPSRVNIGRFANRPYDRTQKPSCQYGIITFHHIPKLIRLATLFTLHFSLFTPSLPHVST